MELPTTQQHTPAEVIVIDAVAKTEGISPVLRQAYMNRLGHPLTEGEVERARQEIALDGRRRRQDGGV